VRFNKKDFPNLHAGNHRDEKGAAKRYNCIAWAAGFDDVIWDHAEGDDAEVRSFWPANAPHDYKVTSLVIAYQSVGFEICADGSLEAGIEKIAIYADGGIYEHAARQLETGKWTSKMGKAEQIEHDAPENLEGPAYGQVVMYTRDGSRDRVHLAERGR
jgi:hypothetical protein